MGRKRIESWSWKDVVATAPRIGIPHFQRGSVWDRSNRVALLESMFEQSPCGSLVTWRPKTKIDVKDIGVPLLDSESLEESPLWLVDGQQRCRSLVSIFQDLTTAGAPQRADQSGALLPADIIEELVKFAPWIRPGLDTISDERMRSVAEAPQDGEDNDEYEDDTSGGATGWFVCIGAIPELRKELTDKLGETKDVSAKQMAKYSMFRTVAVSVLFPRKQAEPTKHVQLPRLLMPLGVLIVPEVWARLNEVLRQDNPEWLAKHMPWGPFFLTGRPNATWDTDLQKKIGSLRLLFGGKKFRNVATRFESMFTSKHFAVDELPRAEVRQAIAAYVRINRAGMRVQDEERALAVLAKWHNGILNLLAEFTRLRDGEPDVRMESDARKLLTHSSEKAFGFALWIRTVVRFVVLRVLANTAQQWLGPDAMERWTVGDKFNQFSEPEAKNVITEAARHAGDALLLVDSLLSNELGFDHRMARPSTRALIPVLDVFAHIEPDELKTLRNTTVGSDLRALLARVIHLTMLHPYLDQAELAGLCVKVHGDACKDGEWGLEGTAGIRTRLRSYLVELHRLWSMEAGVKTGQPTDDKDLFKQLAELATDSFFKLADEAKSLQAQAVGWLYAIERRNHATEFDWASQEVLEMTVRHEGVAIPLEAACTPEKQHIVPFVNAKKFAGKSGTRATASPANAVGNITWLSARQNGFNGFSDKWAVLSEQRDEQNLRARGLLFGEPGGRALDYYESLHDIHKNLGGMASAEELFEKFRTARLEWMKQEMKTWLDDSKELERLASALLT